ncbi:MAG: hypothetical protein NWF00_01565 [Candidatus Bathyarchaeota archaeon]|nr:hypothetical protein [Candidatus Bathyarchaeota archaeon]
MSVNAPNVAVVFGTVMPPQGDVVELQVHLGCSNEVSSFEVVLANFDGKYSPNGENAITAGLDGSVSVGRGASCPLLMTCRVETVKYTSTPAESYVHVGGRCWGERLFRRVVTKTYTNTKGENIVKDLLNYYVGLSHVRDSTELVEATDTTYSSLNYEDTPVFDVLKYVAESADKQGVIGFDFRVAPDGKFEFFSRGTKPNSTSLAERIEQSEYHRDISRVRNKITVYGVADKSIPANKYAWTESLSCADGWWSATAGTVSVDTAVKVKGSGSIQTYAEGLSYAGCIFSLETGSLVDAESYPSLNLWLNCDATFNGNVTLTLYDGSGRMATHEVAVGTGKWFQVQVGVGSKNADQWQLEAGFDWTHIWRLRVVCWFNEPNTGAFWVDGLFFGGKRYSATVEDAGSQAGFGLREQVEVNEELWSDAECTGRAEALLANLKAPAESLTLRSTVLDYGATPILAGDTVHVTLPTEGVEGNFRVLSVEYRVNAASQTLETTLQLGREAPLMADYVYALRAKTDSLSRYKTARR